MISQSGNVAVNALGSRRGIGFHTVVSTGNQAVLDAERLARGRLPSATGCARSRCSSSPTATARGSPRRWPRCAERGDRRRGAQGRRPRRPARGAAAAHTGALAGDQRVFRALVEEAGARLGPRPPRAARAGARAWPQPRPRPRGRGGARRPHLLGRRLGASPPTRPSGSGLDLPDAGAGDPRAARRAAARRRRRSATRSTTRR